MDLKKTNKKLIDELLGLSGIVERYERGESEVPVDIERAKKDFDDLISESYFIAFANGRFGDLLDDIALMLKNPKGKRKQLEIIQKGLQDKALQQLEELKNMPSYEKH